MAVLLSDNNDSSTVQLQQMRRVFVKSTNRLQDLLNVL